MASSQVEMAASAPFGCILRDHNRRDMCRESNSFRKNLKDLVTCINISPDSSDAEQRPDRRNLKLAKGNKGKDILEDSSSALGHEAEVVVDPTLASPPKEAASVSSNQSNRGASSLVQIWEARLGRSNSMKNQTPTANSRSNSPLSCSNEEPSRKPEVGDSFDESRPSQDESVGDWESDRAIHEGPVISSFSSSASSCMSQDQDIPDPAESTRPPRVMDIIRRLTSENDNELRNNAGTESPSRERDRPMGRDHSSEQRGSVVHMTNSPRLRGRHAFNDLLVHMERDRQRELDSLGERRAVSRLSQKGRIQSMLRLKVLQRGLGLHVQAQQHPRSSGCAEGSTSSHSSAIVQLREKFTVTSTNVTETTWSDANATPKTLQNPTTNNMPSSADFPSVTSDKKTVKETHRVEVHDVLQRSSLPEQKEPITAEDIREKSNTPSNITYQGRGFEATSCLELPEQEVNNLRLQEQSETFTSMNDCWYEEGTTEEEGQASDLEEEDLMNNESGYEWFLGVSRPRSYWEDRRQAWYREMLETESDNSDIRRLLERRRVSTFLTSEFRERMNSLMACHLQRQTHQMSEQEDDISSVKRMNNFLSSCLQSHSHSVDRQEEREEEVGQVVREEEVGEEEDQIYMRSHERIDQLMGQDEEEGIYSINEPRKGQNDPCQVNDASIASQEEEEENEEQIGEDEYEEENQNDGMEEESPIERRYHEAREYFNHSNTSSVNMPSPTFVRSWSYRSHEVNNNDHEPVASTSSQEPPNSSPYYHDANWQHFNSIDRLSIEMELINDLRGQMKQLYQEMSELRKSINSCVDMQVKLQDSIKNEIFSVRGERMKPARKGNCCICYEKQVDSLLYRCGHMCTCLKCAHELQWSNGKCPICRAPIMDVVRAYTDS